MKSQLEKNIEILCNEIEKLSCQRMTESVAARLSAYCGAYKALRMIDKEYKGKATYREAYKPETAAKLGNTEFERILAAIPTDREHMIKIATIFRNHLESLKVVNPNAYNSIIEQLGALAKW